MAHRADSGVIEEITSRTTVEIDVSDLHSRSSESTGRACIVLHAQGQADVIYLRPPHDTLVVGRSFPSDVCVGSRSISRQHARFTFADGLVRVEDLGSRNGTWLHGQRIDAATLSSGDELLLGSVRATLSLMHPEPARGQVQSGAAETQDGGIVLRDPAMKALYGLVDRAAQRDVSVLIVGETGTGKEHIATSLHGRGPRASMPFKAINCGAIPENLTGSILFGHERGAFTGAHQRTEGVFEQAHGGTVFLDEVGELPPSVQATLLRVLETKRVVRVGGSSEVPVDVRVVAATHCDVERMVAEGTFRRDLLYRLNTLTLEVPPLRERPDELQALCEVFMRRAERDWQRPASRIDDDAMALLQKYAWPGNIRQLRNVVERAVLLCRDHVIRRADLPGELVNALATTVEGLAPAAEVDADPTAASFREQVRALEVRLIERAMAQTGGNQRAAAALLRMPRRTLVYKLKSYGITTG